MIDNYLTMMFYLLTFGTIGLIVWVWVEVEFALLKRNKVAKQKPQRKAYDQSA